MQTRQETAQWGPLYGDGELFHPLAAQSPSHLPTEGRLLLRQAVDVFDSSEAVRKCQQRNVVTLNI